MLLWVFSFFPLFFLFSLFFSLLEKMLACRCLDDHCMALTTTQAGRISFQKRTAAAPQAGAAAVGTLPAAVHALASCCPGGCGPQPNASCAGTDRGTVVLVRGILWTYYPVFP